MSASATTSAATRRAAHYSPSTEWFTNFRSFPVTGLGPEEGVHRRDPSSVLKVGEIFHVWYTKSVGIAVGFASGDPQAKVFPWDWSEVWHATSPDGINWTEQERAIGAGAAGRYDDRSVFTPEVLEHDGRFYLVYQVVQSPYVVRSFESIALAVADTPFGPWTTSAAPILEPQRDGVWAGDSDNRLAVTEQGSFDSLKVHDPVLLPYDGRFFLYYKGEQMGERFGSGGRSTKWGVAIADSIEGPYTRSPLNPITNSGHETCLWLHGGGVAALLTTDGPERNTIQFAANGLDFEIQSYVPDPPIAAGPVRLTHTSHNPLDGIRQGLCHDVSGEWGFIQGFMIDERQKNFYGAGISPETAPDHHDSDSPSFVAPDTEER